MTAAEEVPTSSLRPRQAKDDRVRDLLLLWEELHDAGVSATPAELCPDDPALWPALARGIEALGKPVMQPVPNEPTNLSQGAAPSPGRRLPEILAGRYRLDRIIGEGGSGQVWQGYDLELKRPVAVKRPRPSAMVDPDRFTAEARRAARLRHPGIVAVHDVGRDPSGGCYIVSDLVNGMDLRRQLLCGPLPVQAALRLAAEVAEALHHAHQNGLVHRDVKPANVLVGGAGSACLTDFGISATGEELASNGNDGCGTLAYVSPEQLVSDGPLDHRTDVYSLGVVLYEMLTGERPFPAAADAASLRQSIAQARPRSPRALNPVIPRAVERICLRCLAKAPEGRYATAKELAADLRRVLARLGRGRFWLLMTVAAVTVALASYNAYQLSRSVTPTRVYDHHDYDVALDRGLDQMHRGNFRGALSYFEAALAMKKSALAHCLAAEAHLGLGEYDEVIACCEAATKIDPTFPKAHRLFGLACERLGRPDEAREAYQRAVRCASPDSMEAIERLRDQAK